MTFLVDINAMVFGMPRALFPALAVNTFHNGAGIAGLLYAAPSVGALVGAGLSGWAGRVRRQGLAVLIAVGVWGASIAGFGFVRVLWVGLRSSRSRVRRTWSARSFATRSSRWRPPTRFAAGCKGSLSSS